MSGEKLKEISERIEVDYMVCSLNPEVMGTGYEINLRQQFSSPSHVEAANWAKANVKNYIGLTIITVYR